VHPGRIGRDWSPGFGHCRCGPASRRTCGIDITDVQRFLGHDDIASTRLYAETNAATLRRKFDQVTAPGGRDLVHAIEVTQGLPAAAFASDLLGKARQNC
jgi:integrase/recombinase XerD